MARGNGRLAPPNMEARHFPGTSTTTGYTVNVCIYCGWKMAAQGGHDVECHGLPHQELFWITNKV